MTNRVLLGAKPGGYGLRVSRPGFDVTNPNLTGQQLAFDSDWLATARILIAGTVSVPAATGGGQVVDVSFGVTLSDFPAAIATGSFSNGIRPLSLGDLGQSFTSTWPTFAGQPFLFPDTFRVYTNRISFARFFSSDFGAYTAQYIVMRPL